MQPNTRIIVGILAIMLCGTTEAALNSKQRVTAFAKLPDWSGVWERFEVGPSGLPDDPEVLKEFLADLAVRPPLNAVWNAKVQAEFAKQKQSKKAAAPLCHTLSFPIVMIGSANLLQVLVTPEETLIADYSGAVRHIDTDGRDHPPPEDRWVTPLGDSVGRWEGQVLIVDTVANKGDLRVLSLFKSDDILDVPLSDQVHTTERIRLLDHNTLEDRMTIDDPLAFEHPWQFTLTFHRVPGLRHTIPADCSEDRNPVMDGQFTLAPPLK